MSYYFLFYQDQILLTLNECIPLCESCPLSLPETETLHPLPAIDGTPCFTASLQDTTVPEGYQLMPLRASFNVLPTKVFQMAGKAREILHWDQTNRFCSVCGGKMALHTNISKRCTQCGREVWPALSTAIIVAITRNEGKEILLVQGKNFKRDYLGLVAGYVETGEDLETCVRREVMEETGLRIRNLRYFASQPWPFPSVLMMGFTAEYESGELHLQAEELRKGGWFDADHLPMVPSKISLARRLIDHWLSEQGRPTDGLACW